MRLPLAVSLESRDGGVTKDCKVLNGIVESRGQDVPAILRKRPGNQDLGLVKVGTAQALTYWNSTSVSVIADYLNVGTVINSCIWNSSDKGSGVAVSGGGLVATMTTGSDDGVRATVSKSTGKWYWEVVVTTKTANLAAGVADASYVTSGAIGTGTHSTGIANATTGAVVFNGLTYDSIGAISTGDILGFALDCDARTLGIYLNNVLKTTVNSANLPSGALYPAVGGNANSGATVYTGNFGAVAFNYTPPSGYSRITTPYTWSLSSSTSLSPTNGGLQFTLQDNGSNSPSSQLMIKNASQAWTLTSGGTLTQITDTDYPGTYSVTLTSLTRSGTVATATTAVDTNFQVGSTVVIAGATPSTYNGSQVITGITPSKTAESADIAITITRSGTTATATTVSEPHGYTNGQTVTISGSDQAEYNGAKTITWISATSFSFTVTVTTPGLTSPATTSSGWYASINMTPRDSSITVSGGTATVTWPDHGLETGAGVNVSYFSLNSTHIIRGAITVTDANTFTIATVEANVGPTFALSFAYIVPAISSITGSGSTATMTFASAHHITRYANIGVFGAVQPTYNGYFLAAVTGPTTITYEMVGVAAAAPATPATGTIIANSNTTVPAGASFTFSISGSPVTPATGTITATGGRNTVPGIAYLDGYFCVMDVNGVIYNSAEDDPSTWNALEFVTALAETGAGKAISRSLNYIVAFKEWSTELWYNAAKEPPGSPLGPVDDGLILVGCASGDSVVRAGEGLLFWISQTREKGRGVHLMQGRQPSKISTPDVDRILAADDLATVRALSLRVDGHQLYLLTLETSNITLCYDLQSQSWTQWSSYTLNGSSVSVSSITRSDTTATVTTSTAHGLSDGDPVKMAGANQSDYNGIFQAFVVSSTVFTIEVANSPTTPATGTITATPYTESYFKFTKYADANGADVLLHETDGHLYQMLSTLYQDAGLPINRFCRSTRLDGGSDAWKTMPAIRLIGDAGTAKVALRWSDDDCATFVAYRTLDMSLEKPETRRCGKFRRRTLAFRDIGNTAERWEAAEIDIGGQ